MAVAQEPMYNIFQSTGVVAKQHAKVYKINYVLAKTVATWIGNGKSSLLSKHGKMRVDELQNKIWISDTDAVLAKVSALIHLMDCPSKQVLIKAKIINIDDNYLRQIGGTLGDQFSDASPTGTSWGSGLDGVHTGRVSVPILKTGNETLSYTLAALIEQGHAVLVASPTLLTQDRVQAQIEAGEEVPYQEKSGTGNTSVAFKKAVLRLQVTPKVLPNHKIELTVRINQDQLSGLDFNGAPAIKTQQLKTRAVVHDGYSLVLGGIEQSIQGHSHRGIPFISHIPVLGWLLSSREHKHTRRQLVVIITPKQVA